MAKDGHKGRPNTLTLIVIILALVLLGIIFWPRLGASVGTQNNPYNAQTGYQGQGYYSYDGTIFYAETSNQLNSTLNTLAATKTQSTTINTTTSVTTSFTTTIPREVCNENVATVYLNGSTSCGKYIINLTNIVIAGNALGPNLITTYVASLLISYNGTTTELNLSDGEQYQFGLGNLTLFLWATKIDPYQHYTNLVLSNEQFPQYPNYTTSASSGYDYIPIHLPKTYILYLCGGASSNLSKVTWNQSADFTHITSIGGNQNSTCILTPAHSYPGVIVGMGINSTIKTEYTNYYYPSSSNVSFNVSESPSLVAIIVAGNEWTTYPGQATGLPLINITPSQDEVYCTISSQDGTDSINLNITSEYGTGTYEYSVAGVIICKSIVPYTLQIKSPELYNTEIGIYNFNFS